MTGSIDKADVTIGRDDFSFDVRRTILRPSVDQFSHPPVVIDLPRAAGPAARRALSDGGQLSKTWHFNPSRRDGSTQ